MTLEHMRYFVAAAKYLNFSRAADSLFIHQTTISRAISSLEDEIGGALFTRMRYSLQLTPLGQLTLRLSTELLAQYDRMENTLRSEADNFVGELSLSIPSAYIPVLVDAYADFHREKPKVVVAVESYPYGRLNTLCDAIEDRLMDAGICFSFNYPADNPNLCSLKLMEENHGLAIQLDNPLAKEKSIHLSQIHNTRFLASQHMGKEFLNDMKHALENPARGNEFIFCDGETLLLQFASGYGITAMPSRVAESDNFVFVPIEGMPLQSDILFVWHRENKNPALHMFLDCLREHFSPD